MASTTDEFWSVRTPGPSAAEVSLNQPGWNIKTFGGSRYDLPTRRGSNIELPYRPGQIHRKKTPESRVITLLMWMTGTDPATGEFPTTPPLGVAAGCERDLVWNNNWDTLRRLVWMADGSQVTLTRRWRLSSNFANTSADPTLADSVMLVANASAEMTENMAPSMTGRHRADFALDFTLADPYFYGVEQEVTIPANGGGYISVVNFGHAIAAHAFVGLDLIGPLTAPILVRNGSITPDIVVTYSANIPTGKCVGLNISQARATLFDGPGCTGTTTNVIGNVTHRGERFWLGAYPAPLVAGGVNLFNMTTGSGGDTGTAEFRYKPPYI